MVALTYDVRTVRIPIPRVVLGARRPRRSTPPVVVEHWQRASRLAEDRRRDAHLDAALAFRR
jgi:hypothetical protein